MKSGLQALGRLFRPSAREEHAVPPGDAQKFTGNGQLLARPGYFLRRFGSEWGLAASGLSRMTWENCW